MQGVCNYARSNINMRNIYGVASGAEWLAFWALLPKPPQARRKEALGEFKNLMDDCINHPYEAYRQLSVAAFSLAVEDVGLLLLWLLSKLHLQTVNSDIAGVVKAYISHAKSAEDKGMLRDVRDKLASCLGSEDEDAREVALEIATFPSMLELWTESSLPQENF